MSIQTTSQQFISPVDVSHHSPTKENPIPRSLINQWKTEGYALISGLFSTDLIGNARDQIQKLVAKNANVVSEDFGGLSFPFQDTRDQSEILLNPVNPLTAIVLNPIMLSLAKACLETEDIQMTQAEAWLKHCNLSSDRSVYSNQDQRIHMDYPNHTLLHPPSWEHPEVIAAILYLDDSDVCGGSTAVVANNGSGNKDPLYKMPYDRMPGVGSHRWLNDRAKTEEYFEVNDPDIFTFRQEIYKREKYVNFTMGSVLLYRHDVWHRGTPIKPGQTRIVINLAYKKASSSWVTAWGRGFAFEAYESMWGILPLLNSDQRAALGVPEAAWPEEESRAEIVDRNGTTDAVDNTIERSAPEKFKLLHHISLLDVQARYKQQRIL